MCVCDYVDSRCTYSASHDDGLNKQNMHRILPFKQNQRQNSQLGTCSSKGIQHHKNIKT